MKTKDEVALHAGFDSWKAWIDALAAVQAKILSEKIVSHKAPAPWPYPSHKPYGGAREGA